MAKKKKPIPSKKRTTRKKKSVTAPRLVAPGITIDNSSLKHGNEVSRQSQRMNDHVIHHYVTYEDGQTLLELEYKEVEIIRQG